MQRIPPHLTCNARALRRDATPAERMLWRLLSRHRPRFTRQLVIGRHIVDLACREARLAIEVDGGQHAEQADDDAVRTAVLAQAGWTVLRFWNNDVLGNPTGVAESILAKVAELRPGTHPRPLPFREGRRRAPTL